MLSNNPVRVSLPEGRHKLLYVFPAFVPVPYATTKLRTHAKVEQDAIAQSTINLDGTYVVQESINIDDLSLKIINVYDGAASFNYT
jgi:hypothetical protein